MRHSPCLTMAGALRGRSMKCSPSSLNARKYSGAMLNPSSRRPQYGVFGSRIAAAIRTLRPRRLDRTHARFSRHVRFT